MTRRRQPRVVASSATFFDHATPDDRSALAAEIAQARRQFGTHAPLRKSGSHPLYELPLISNIGQASFYWISNFVDHDPAHPPATETITDYECGTRSYDLSSGYNHTGIDYAPWPFWWHQMDQQQVEVRAAAPGTLLIKSDGRDDRECALSGKTSNRVVVEHADGSLAIYEHMAKGSLTMKNTGETIGAGEYLGLVGSSGSSTAPHLHLETRLLSLDGDLIDPFDGACNDLNPGDSWWQVGEQEPYYNPAIAQVATHAVLVTEELLAPACPVTTHDPQYDNAPAVDETFYFAVYLRDEQEGDTLTVRLRRVGGPVIETFSNTAGPEVEDLVISFYAFTINPIAQAGDYRLDATWTTQQGQKSQSHSFEVIGDRVFRDGFSAGN